MSTEYLEMGDRRKSYFKKDGNKLEKISSKEYRQATKAKKSPQKKTRSKRKESSPSPVPSPVLESLSHSYEYSYEYYSSNDDKKKRSSSDDKKKRSSSDDKKKRSSDNESNKSSSDDEKSDNSTVSLDTMKKLIGEIVSKKDSIAQLVGSSFTNEELGIIEKKINPSIPQPSFTGGYAIEESVGGNEPQEEHNNDHDVQTTHHHVLSRTPVYNNNVARFPVPDEYVNWDVAYPDYLPTEYSAIMNVADADPNDITKIDHSEFTDEKTRPGLNYGLISYSFDHSGRPLNIYGRTGLRGKGSLKYWGPNWNVFPMFIRQLQGPTNTNTNIDDIIPNIQIMLLRNGEAFSCPMPISYKKTYEKIIISDTLYKAVNKCGKSLDSMIVDVNCVATTQCYIDSPLNTDNAWINASVYVYNVTDNPMNDDCVIWVPINSCSDLEHKMDPEHFQILKELMGDNIINSICEGVLTAKNDIPEHITLGGTEEHDHNQKKVDQDANKKEVIRNDNQSDNQSDNHRSDHQSDTQPKPSHGGKKSFITLGPSRQK
jgi:ADP-ribose pyrophosphatase